MQRYSITFDETLKAKRLLDHTNSCSHSWKNQLQDTNPATELFSCHDHCDTHALKRSTETQTQTSTDPFVGLGVNAAQRGLLILKRLLRSFLIYASQKARDLGQIVLYKTQTRLRESAK